MSDSIKKAAEKLQKKNREHADEISACLDALNSRFSNDDTLKSYAITSRIVREDDRTLLVVQQGLEHDRDYGELIVGIDRDGWLVGPWDEAQHLWSGMVAVDSAEGRELMDNFETTVVKTFKVRV